MPQTLASVLLGGLVLLVTAVTSTTLQAQSIEETLEAIAEELRESQGRSADDPGSPDAAGREGADGSLPAALERIPMDLDLPFDTFSKAIPLPASDDKISQTLLQLVDGHQSKGAFDLAEQAEDLGIPYVGGQAGVRLFAESESGVAALQQSVERQGGEVITTFRNVVYARLPLDSVKSLGSLHELHYMDAEPVHRPMALNPNGGFGEQVGEGVDASAARRLHKAGVTGKGVKVGILDWGFEGYGKLVRAGELPKARAGRVFRPEPALEANGVHGTGCAEIIADMAPEAELYLAAIDGREGEIIQAALWLAQQGVDIINYSGGGHHGPHNGRAILDRLVQHVVDEYGVLWVTSAGNDGASHWTQQARDRNRNGAIDNVGDYPDVIALKVTGSSFAVLVTWDDWGTDPAKPTSTQDIDAYLLRRTASRKFELVASSQGVQNGRGIPVERIGISGARAGMVFYLALHLKRVQRAVRTHVYAMHGVRLFPVVPAYSISIPATASAAVAVGAVDLQEDRLARYSSQGPTDDRRQKPEVSAPANISSIAYAGKGGRFHGTSAASPHVAGFAALLKQLSPQSSVPQLRQAVLSHVTPSGNGTPNHQYGHGRIHAGKVNADMVEPEFERILRDILQGR